MPNQNINMINSTTYKKLIAVSIEQLHEIQNPSAKTKLKNTAKKMLGRSVADKDIMFWPAGMLLLGLVQALDSNYIDDATRKRIIKEINNHLDICNQKVEYVDDCLAGVALIKYMIYIQNNYTQESTLIEQLSSYIDKIYSFISNCRTDSTGSIIYNNKAQNDYIFADGCGMITMFLSAYAAAFNNDEARILAEKQLYDFMNYGMDKRTGLPYHGYSQDENEQKGIIGWGRAVGWIIMGLSEYVQLDTTCKLFTNMYQKLITSVLAYQREDGGYSWQLECTGGHIDTSATAMITYSLLPATDANIYNKIASSSSAEKINSIDNTIDTNSSDNTNNTGDSNCYASTNGTKKSTIIDIQNLDINNIRTSIDKSRTCLINHIDESGHVTNSLSACIDFAVHYQTYGCYPWGQGATIASLTEV